MENKQQITHTQHIRQKAAVSGTSCLLEYKLGGFYYSSYLLLTCHYIIIPEHQSAFQSPEMLFFLLQFIDEGPLTCACCFLDIFILRFTRDSYASLHPGPRLLCTVQLICEGLSPQVHTFLLFSVLFIQVATVLLPDSPLFVTAPQQT